MSSSAVLTSVRRLRGLLAAQRGQDDGDEQLLYAFADHHDDSAFATLVRRHGPMVLGVCRRVLGHEQDAEDAFQATFLVLARRAAALRDKTALASFLHGTAYHLASKAKRAAGRRRKHEGQTPPRPPTNPSDDLLWREVRTLLDEEIARLPRKYRSVFVLCCLETLSRAEAGRQLGLKERTVSNRLAEARKCLQQRLTRRGVELTALLAATALTTETASALPVALLMKASGGTVAPAVAALVEAGSAMLSVSKAKMATALVLAASVLTGTAACGLALSRKRPAEPPAAQASDKPPSAPPKRETAKIVEIHGRVLDLDGEPKAGAKLLICGTPSRPAVPVLRATAGSDGRFAIRLGAYAITRASHDLLATAEGCGTDWINLHESTEEIILRLPRDVQIRGQLLDLQGRPLAGAAVRVVSLATTAGDNLDDFLQRWRSERDASKQPLRYKNQSQAERLLKKRTFSASTPSLLLPVATTDARGQFTLHGVGRDRVAELRISGAGLADTWVHVVARTDFRPDKPTEGPYPLYGPRFTLPVGPDRPIAGIVRELKTGKPLAGARVSTSWRGSSTVSDAEGRFRLGGLAKSPHYQLYCQPAPGQDYLPRSIDIADTHGIEALSTIIELERGILVSGRLFNKATGRPVCGDVRYQPREGNRDGERLAGIFPLSAFTDTEGHYQLTIPPGPGVLVANARDDRTPHPFLAARVAPADRDPKLFYVPFEVFRTVGGGGMMPLSFYNAYRLLDPKPATKALTYDFPVDPGKRRTGKLVDADGQPVKGAMVCYLRQRKNRKRLPGAEFTAEALDPAVPCRMFFEHKRRGLIGTTVLRGDEPEPIIVRMEKTAAVTGRLVGPDGKPLAGRHVSRDYVKIGNVFGGTLRDALGESSFDTDGEGRFRLEGIVPGFAFHVVVSPLRSEEDIAVSGELRLKAGEVKDLGDCRIKLTR